ncbi:hypothetical protein AVEN_235216-1 [Araneus ventricosus]|uniref:Uncharacterized protein n=1 Tax=Araneus ventricosus TaxID=182803 RepID=A0A4Y2A4K8_ARAVE|nr:hypothetical protein AVEN_235216-1 [Araneus ventricosus]
MSQISISSCSQHFLGHISGSRVEEEHENQSQSNEDGDFDDLELVILPYGVAQRFQGVQDVDEGCFRTPVGTEIHRSLVHERIQSNSFHASTPYRTKLEVISTNNKGECVCVGAAQGRSMDLELRNLTQTYSEGWECELRRYIFWNFILMN